MALTGSSSPHFYLARSRSTSLPPLSSSSSKSSSVSPFAAFCSALTWPNHVLPSLALAFDEPSFFADLRVDINPIITPTSSSSTPSSPSSPSSSSSTSSPLSSSSSSTQHVEGQECQHSTNTEESSPRPGQDCVWVHRMVVAVHSPVFRSLLRSGPEAGGSRESREGVIDMRGAQHPPGRVVRCLLKMMYASPGLAIDELGHEPKLSDEWEFLLQLFKLAHLYQVEVVLDACTRRLKHILEQRKDITPAARQATAQPHRRGYKAAAAAAAANAAAASAEAEPNSGEMSDDEEERTRQTCYALELLAFLLHIKEAETSDHPHSDHPPSPTSTTTTGRRSQSAPDVSLSSSSSTQPREVDSSGDDVSTAQGPSKKAVEVGVEAEEAVAVAPVGEQREEMLVRMLDHHLYPQLAMIVQHIRCEDVLTLQHLLQLSVCTARPSSPTTAAAAAAATASLTPPWPGGMRATSHAKLYSA